ncbi:MAG: hypothetical protein QFE16_14575 [Pseudomonadota bacterium]|nr:hypothetical protein [Pseudomonadota bacterium]
MSGAAIWRAGIALSALLAALNLLAGASGGLARFGLATPPAAVGVHGAVMACGFFGTLIALERAVALRRFAGLIAPLAAGVGGVLAWALHAEPAAQMAWAIAAIALVGLYLYAGFTRAWSLPLAVELCGALCWGVGTAAWAAGDLASGVTGWTAFLVLTIAAERRELTRMLHLPVRAHRLFMLVIALALAAVTLGVADSFGADTGASVNALWWTSCALLAMWLLRWDIAPRQWRRPGWLGHTAQCLTVGYVWLLAGALLGLAGLRWPEGATALARHAVLLGFVFAMVFGHAPIILPALAHVRPVYSAWARVPIWILSASLLVRGAAIAAGSGLGLALAGAGHALAIAWFAGAMVFGVTRSQAAAS